MEDKDYYTNPNVNWDEPINSKCPHCGHERYVRTEDILNNNYTFDRKCKKVAVHSYFMCPKCNKVYALYELYHTHRIASHTEFATISEVFNQQ